MGETGKRADPFLVFRFEVSFTGFAKAGFSECTGLQLETEVETYQEGGRNTHERKFPTRTKQSPLVLKRGIVDRQLWNWYADLVQGKLVRRSATIQVKDYSGQATVMEFEIKDCFPIKWVGPDLNAKADNIAVETLELAHDGLVWRK